MKLPTRLWILLATVMAAIILLVSLKTGPPAGDEGRSTEGGSGAADAIRGQPASRPVLGRPSRELMQVGDIVRLGPDDWKNRFVEGYPEVDPEFKAEIVLLAGELEEAVAGGLDPGGEEALVYGEAILILLSERKEPRPEEPQQNR